MKKIKGFKAFNKGLICNEFQFKEGETFETEKLKMCESGFHFCENPLDVLDFYELTESEFAEVEAVGKTLKDDDGKKSVTDKITIKAKLDLSGFVKASVDFLLEITKFKATEKEGDLNDKGKNSAQLASSGDSAQLASSGDSAKLASSGDYAKLASSGDSAKLASSGDSAKLASSGDYAKLASSGDYAKLASSGDSAQLASSGDSAKLELNGSDSVGAGMGIQSKIKGRKGNWITLSEWKWSDEKKRWIPLCVKSAQIDGKILKEDTFYVLQNGEFVEAQA